MKRFFSPLSLIVLTAIVSFALVISIWLAFQPAKGLEADFLDIGQGDSVLAKTPAGQNLLIDGGPDKTVLRRLSENLPWYDRQIDLMILTHPHDDHLVGLQEVLKRYRVKQVLYTGVSLNSPAYQAWLEYLKRKRIPVRIIDKPQTVYFSDDCYLKILYPDKSLAGLAMENLNDSSIVAKLVYRNTKILLTGDAEAEVEQALIKEKTDLQADVLKVPHHGSDNGSTENFLAAVGAKIAVVQVGAANKFGHPSKRTLSKLARAKTQVWRNDLQGTVKLFSDGSNIFLTAAHPLPAP